MKYKPGKKMLTKNNFRSIFIKMQESPQHAQRVKEQYKKKGIKRKNAIYKIHTENLLNHNTFIDFLKGY